ncbi:MAG: SIR2 family protein [Desulfurellaceae bacterium]|nr:SIR2 family protein [Desulfurellaceae bacterium]
MIDLIRREFEGSDAEAEFDQSIAGESANRYQSAFAFLHGRRGQDVANKIVRTAVWQALDGNNWPSHLLKKSPRDADFATCQTLEAEVDAWVLPRTVDILGNLLVTCSETFGRAVLTTNFDPLIEVSVSKHSGRFYRTVLHDDGNLGQTVGEGTHIVHLHGYWYGYDTLHTPQQLTHPRPQLGKSLARVVEASTLVVIGYSGWDDVMTRTLVDLLSDSESTPEIIWAFHEEDPATIEASNERLLALLEPGIGRGRVSLYRGIDCCSVLEELHKQLKLSDSATSGTTRGSQTIPIVNKEEIRGGVGQHQIHIQINLEEPQQSSAELDRPLFVTPWVGREQELNMLASLSTPVAFITGLGGQGKSALAGQFLQQQAITPSERFEFWDWRDCREESDRLSTQILRLIERLSNGAIDASRIEATDIRAVIGILFRVLQDRKALLVFDNVDQYVDLETLGPVKGLDVLISEAQARGHHSLFLFTCRPDIQVDESRAIRIPLAGFTEDETRELIKARNVRKQDWHLAEELYQITQGHPLWVNLVAMQALRHKDGLRGALDLIKQGGATLPDTTKTIWGMLNAQQRSVLRTMAELDRPEPENQLLEFLPGINFNRVNKALRTLRSFHLIETRTQSGSEPLLGLHPIIREFVRSSFPKREREKSVGAILGFLDRMIGRFKVLLPQDPSYEILEHWIQKAELQIRFGRFEEATSTIAEIVSPLINRGYSEEMIRMTMRLLDDIDWAEACSSYKDFDNVFEKCLTQMVQIGHDASKDLLTRYEAAIPGRSSQFILLCDLQCYANWYTGQYDSAIRWGEEGERLKKSTSVDTKFSTSHNLALSRRDAGRVSEALESFLDGTSLVVVVKPGGKIPDQTAPFYGNIGRCLFLMNRLEEALICYVKSAQLLEESLNQEHLLINKGYIRCWIAELLAQAEEFDLAAALYRAAMYMWDDSSPPRSAQAKDKLETLVTEYPELRPYLDEEGERAETTYRRWLNRQ